MSYALSRHTIASAYHTASRAHHALSQHRERGEKMVGQLTQTATVGVSALGFGFLNGYLGPKANIMGKIPIDLGAGVLLQAAAYLNLAGKYDEMLHNFADGAIAAYLTKLGAGMGANKAAGKPAISGTGNGNMPGSHYPRNRMGTSFSGVSDSSPMSDEDHFRAARQA